MNLLVENSAPSIAIPLNSCNQPVDAILTIDIVMATLDDYVTDVLMRDLVGHDRRPASFLVYLWLAAEQQRRKTGVQISYQELAENTGISKSSVQAAISWLVRRKLLAASKENATAVPVYKVLTPWKRY